MINELQTSLTLSEIQQKIQQKILENHSKMEKCSNYNCYYYIDNYDELKRDYLRGEKIVTSKNFDELNIHKKQKKISVTYVTQFITYCVTVNWSDPSSLKIVTQLDYHTKQINDTVKQQYQGFYEPIV